MLVTVEEGHTTLKVSLCLDHVSLDCYLKEKTALFAAKAAKMK